MSRTPDSVTSPKLAARLQNGERVWLKHEPARIVAGSLLVSVLLFLTVAMDSRSVRWPMAFIWLYVAWGWVRILAIRLRFTGTTVEASEQVLGISLRRIPLADIVAARVARVTYDVRGVYVCQLAPSRGSALRWVALWSGPSQTVANTILAELSRRCSLTEISPVSEEYRTPLLREPTVWQRPGFDPTLLPVPKRRR